MIRTMSLTCLLILAGTVVSQAAAQELAAARLGGPRLPANARASGATTVHVVFNQPALLSAWVEYFPSNCTLDSSGSWAINTAPKKGTTSTAILNAQLGNGDCPGVTFPFNALYYTWSAQADNGAKDKLTATWSTPDGEFNEEESFILVLESLVITSPYTDEQDALDQSNYTATSPVSFTAQAADTTTAISWTADLHYATSGGKGSYSSSQTFSTQPEATQTETYTSQGGQIKTKATQGPSSADVTSYVVGASIPQSAFTTVLGGLYSTGATPTLLEQIATYESSYAQFTSRTLFHTSALWPTESYDGGSHIGLMQVPVKDGIGVDFDYNQNAQAGATLFTGNIGLATRRLKKIRSQNKGLPEPTGVQIENEALSFYNVGTGPSYYIVTTGSNGMPQWTENTAGDPMGTAYADCVRQQVVGARQSCS
jgi:hypothetical protein